MKNKSEEIYEAGYAQGLREAGANMKQAEPRNQTAFVVGVIAGLFGFWGLAHILNDKVGKGILWMFIGAPVILGILYGSAVMTAGIGLIIALPLHIYIVYVQAKNGASNL